MSKFNTAYVDTSRSSCDGDATYNARYSLTLYKQGVQHGSKTAIVVLKNPASTCKDHIFFSTSLQDIYDVDKTTTHIINTLFANGSPYDKIITLNLFPYYDNIPATINSVYKNLLTAPHISYQTNLAKITSILQNNSGADIFCAWGHSSNIFEAIYKKAINDVISILQTNNVSTYKYYNQNGLHAATLPTQPFYPPHGSKW